MFQVIPQRGKIIDSTVRFLRIVSDEIFHQFPIKDIRFINVVDASIDKLLLDSAVKPFQIAVRLGMFWVVKEVS